MTTALAVVGVGVAAAALAKVELKRRRQREKPPSRLKRLTLEQIDLAMGLLEGQGRFPRERNGSPHERGQSPPERTIHETRKALKRARALVRLQRSALGRKRFRSANAALRKAGQRLATARDAEVVVDALDATIGRGPKRLARSVGVARLHLRLVEEREQAQAHTRHGAHMRGVVLGELQDVRRDLERWQPSQGDEKTAREGLHHIYRQGRRRGRRARKAGTSEALHDWRKRVKDLRYAAEMLELRKLAKRADRLGETIGEEHDLWLLDKCLRGHRGCFKGDKAAGKELQRLIARRRARLRKRAFKLGKELYRQPPKRFVRRRLPR
jgi:CHAD domain-containing protein